MKHHIHSALSALSTLFSVAPRSALSAGAIVAFSFNVACAGTPSPHAASGIDVRLNMGTSELRPEGVLHVQGLHDGVSAHLPVAPLDPGSNTQRVPLPPGSYSVSYSPAVLDGALDSARNRAPAKILSQNPFLIEVGEGEFRPIDVRGVTGAPATAPRPGRQPLAGR